MEQILVNENRSLSQDFQRSVDNVIAQSNELIDSFEKFQSFKVISRYEEAIELIRDPSGMMDQVLLSAVNLKVRGDITLNPGIIAQMVNVDRDSWQNLTSGRQISSDCVPCRRIKKIRKGQKSISLAEFQQYQEYLIFNEKGARFSVNQSAVDTKKESFKSYAKSPAQIELMQHFKDLVSILNDHLQRGYCGAAAMQEISRLLKLRFVNNQVYQNDEILISLIYKLQ